MMGLKFFGTVAVGGMLAIVGAKTAEAVPAYAYSEIQFTNFDLNLSSVTVIPGSTVQGYTSTNMTGYASTSVTTPGNLSTGVPNVPGYSGPLGTSFASSGLGMGNAAGANWGMQLTTSTGAQAQQLISGAISGPSTSSYQVSEAHLTEGSQAAGASTDSNTVITIDVSALAGKSVSLSATVLTSLLASFGTAGDIANASSSATFTVKNASGTIVYQDSNPLVNNPNTSVQALFPGVSASYTSGPVAINDTYTFVTTGNYALTLYDNTTANVVTTAVATPEPLSAAIMGSGLAMLGVIRRRRKN